MSELKINAAILLGILLSLAATSFMYEPKAEYIYFLMGAVTVVLIRAINSKIIKNK